MATHITPYQRREILRLRGIGQGFKMIARTTGLTPKQVQNFWYGLSRQSRAAISQLPSPAEQYREEALVRAKRALAEEIALARQERHTSPPFKVSPLLW